MDDTFNVSENGRYTSPSVLSFDINNNSDNNQGNDNNNTIINITKKEKKTLKKADKPTNSFKSVVDKVIKNKK